MRLLARSSEGLFADACRRTTFMPVSTACERKLQISRACPELRNRASGDVRISIAEARVLPKKLHIWLLTHPDLIQAPQVALFSIHL